MPPIQRDTIIVGETAKYRIDKVIGEGGVGIVYRAKRLHDGRTVAVKTLHGTRSAINDTTRADHGRDEAVDEALILGIVGGGQRVQCDRKQRRAHRG